MPKLKHGDEEYDAYIEEILDNEREDEEYARVESKQRVEDETFYSAQEEMFPPPFDFDHYDTWDLDHYER